MRPHYAKAADLSCNDLKNIFGRPDSRKLCDSARMKCLRLRVTAVPRASQSSRSKNIPIPQRFKTLSTGYSPSIDEMRVYKFKSAFYSCGNILLRPNWSRCDPGLRGPRSLTSTMILFPSSSFGSTFAYIFFVGKSVTSSTYNVLLYQFWDKFKSQFIDCCFSYTAFITIFFYKTIQDFYINTVCIVIKYFFIYLFVVLPTEVHSFLKCYIKMLDTLFIYILNRSYKLCLKKTTKFWWSDFEY